MMNGEFDEEEEFEGEGEEYMDPNDESDEYGTEFDREYEALVKEGKMTELIRELGKFYPRKKESN